MVEADGRNRRGRNVGSVSAVKPEDLHPTHAALHDDDGRSAYVPGRRRWTPGFSTQHPPPPGGYNPRLDARRESERRYAARYPERRRASGKRPKRGESGRHCVECQAPIAGGTRTLCPSCAMRRRWLGVERVNVQRDLTTPYRDGLDRGHERRVRQLQAIQKALPL